MGKNADRIQELVLQECSHGTAEQIFARVTKDCPTVVLATVYNNLNRLVDEGKLRRIRVAGQADRYDKPTRHDHLVCVKCGALCDVTISDYTQAFAQQVGVDVLSYDLNLHYLCDQCKQSK